MPVTYNSLSFQLHGKCKKIQWDEVEMTEIEYFDTFQKRLC